MSDVERRLNVSLGLMLSGFTVTVATLVYIGLKHVKKVPIEVIILLVGLTLMLLGVCLAPDENELQKEMLKLLEKTLGG